ncbi:MAG: phosphate acyltransferase PlsX [Pseudomonadota bacterium]
MQNLVISVDAMGGDLGPAAVVDGMARSAKKNAAIRFIVHGDAATLDPMVARRADLAERCEVRHSERVVEVAARPSSIIRRGQGTSMWAAVDAVREGEATVAVSGGNTGALMALAGYRLGKAEIVNRPAIAVLWPSRNRQGYTVVLDVGADVRAESKDLLQYAIMGAEYARVGLGLPSPRIGLLNVGTEAYKGHAELHAAADLISAWASQPDAGFTFVGFVEGDAMPGDQVDVVVTDGFTGNIALKAAEGTARLVRDFLKHAFEYSILSRIGALFAYTSLGRLAKRIDPRQVNGGVFLGLNGAVVKSHGAADGLGISAAIKLAFRLAEGRFTEKVAGRLATLPIASEDMFGGRGRSQSGLR